MSADILGYVAFFIAVAVMTMGTFGYLSQRSLIRRSLESIRTSAFYPDLRSRQLSPPLVSRLILPGIKKVGHIARRISPHGAVQRLGNLLDYAGGITGWDAERVLAFKLLGTIAGGVLGLFVGLAGNVGFLRMPVFLLALGGVGYYLPDWLLRSRADKRQANIRRALPDCLDLLSITVQAGLGFDAAVYRVARQIGGPLGSELHRVVQEMQLGKTRIDALRGLADRTDSADVRSFVLSMVQADIFGISVAKVLAIQADEMRVRRRQSAEERAQKIPVKIIFPLLFCIFPALFIVLAGPAAIRIYDSLLRL